MQDYITLIKNIRVLKEAIIIITNDLTRRNADKYICGILENGDITKRSRYLLNYEV